MGKTSILIVEDEAVVAADLSDKLERTGYRIIGTASEGEHAIRLAAGDIPDLVLMDIRLKGQKDGIEIAEQLHQRFHVPIVYLTAHSDADTLKRAQATEPFGYILKPFDTRDLRTQIEIALYKYQAERALRDSETRYRAVVETALDSIMTIDSSGEVQSCNASTEAMFGYPCADVIGRQVTMLVPELALTSERDDRSLQREHDGFYGMWREVNGHHRDGHMIPLEIALNKIVVDDRVLFTAIMRDLTEKQQAETEIRWRAGLLEQAHEAVLVWRMGAGIIYWNNGARTLYGWTSEEAAGRLSHDLLRTTLPWPQQEFNQRLVHDGSWQGELTQRTKDGRDVIVESQMVTMPDSRGGVLVMETNRDVTERHAIHEKVCRLADDLANANEELTRSNIELDAFAYIASHDLKEPLRGIHHYARFVLEDYENKLDQEGKHKLQTIMTLTERMDDLINGILHYSRLSREDIGAEPTSMLDLIRRVVQSLTPRLNELKVTVRVADQLPTLPVNPTMFQEVFANLITNAMKYNDKPDKWIEIGMATDASSSQVAKAAAEGQIVMYVKDNGIGIPANRQEQIFQIFRRLHNRDAYGGGTGVGLTIAKKVIDRHGGRLWVESEPAVGSTFFLTLPR